MFFRETINEKLFGKKACPVDHKNRNMLQKQGTDHISIDKPLEHKDEISHPKSDNK